MEKIVEALLTIEQRADAVLDKLAGDKSSLTKRINEEIARRTVEIDHETQRVINEMYETASVETNDKVEQISLDAQRGISMVETAFEHHREKWRAALVHNIIQKQ